jgi:putative FmdB family regulatory protein
VPTYEYECEACGHTLEAFQGISEKPLRKCPECGRRKLRKLIGAGAGLIFRGEGFYATDYRSKDYKEKAKKEEGGAGTKGEAESKSGGESGGKGGPGASSKGASTDE